jgi:hypothetical protein
MLWLIWIAFAIVVGLPALFELLEHPTHPKWEG